MDKHDEKDVRYDQEHLVKLENLNFGREKNLIFDFCRTKENNKNIRICKFSPFQGWVAKYESPCVPPLCSLYTADLDCC